MDCLVWIVVPYVANIPNSWVADFHKQQPRLERQRTKVAFHLYQIHSTEPDFEMARKQAWLLVSFVRQSVEM